MNAQTEEATIERLLEVLSISGVANTQNGLIHSISVWLEMHVKVANIESRKREAFNDFAGYVREVIKQRRYKRMLWLEDIPLPSPIIDEKTSEDISDQILRVIEAKSFDQGLRFLAELWGGWVLVCPVEIVQNSPEFAAASITITDDDELIDYMLRYLDIYGSM
jgi:hypothetical protein